MSYQAIVGRVSQIIEIPKADNIVLGVVLNENVVVKKGTK